MLSDECFDGLPLTGPMKSEVDFYVDLTQHLLNDVASILDVDLSRDAAEMRRRVGNEGLSFLTKRLPSLGKSFDAFLAGGPPPNFTGFALRKDAVVPRFLGSLWSSVYPMVTSELVLKHLRQILYFLYKLKLPYQDELITKVIESFIETDARLPETLSSQDSVLDLAAKLAARITCRFSIDKMVPKHGPGAVSDRLKHWEKMAFRSFYPDVEKDFPFYEWMVPSLSAVAFRDPSTLVESQKRARVVLVPKDSRGPRLISCEPSTLQYLQQGIANQLVSIIESHPLTKGHVNFSDQEINRRYAMYGSMGAGWATLDMKDASDRVSLALVERVFGMDPRFVSYLLSTRSTETELPDKRIVKMRKFAPMGSALCFPVESLVFFLLAVSVLVTQDKSNTYLHRKVKRACSSVWVYGDDIICASKDSEAIVQYFETVGLLFNKSKCCVAGHFRESCGLDAYNGVDVTPTRIKTIMSSCLRSDPAALSSWCALQRALRDRGYWDLSDAISRWIQKSIQLPVLTESNPSIGFLYLLGTTSTLQSLNRRRYNVDYQRLEYRCWTVQGVTIKVPLTWVERLHWNFSNVFFDLADVPRFPVRRRVSLTRRWCGVPHGV